MKSHLFSIGVATLTLAASIPPLHAADPAAYPTRPVRVISGSPGSTADITARFIGHKLGE